MSNLLRSTLFLVALCVTGPRPVDAAPEVEKGFFGFAIEVDGSGLLNPTVRSARITKIVPASPAGRAGIATGDELISVEGHAVAGAKARELQPIMQKQVGQSLHLRLKRPTGTEYGVTLVAIAKPPGS
jgi:C-terminal processing protease CtpA/Prc